jgi:hypothetical protein
VLVLDFVGSGECNVRRWKFCPQSSGILDTFRCFRCRPPQRQLLSPTTLDARTCARHYCGARVAFSRDESSITIVFAADDRAVRSARVVPATVRDEGSLT